MICDYECIKRSTNKVIDIVNQDDFLKKIFDLSIQALLNPNDQQRKTYEYPDLDGIIGKLSVKEKIEGSNCVRNKNLAQVLSLRYQVPLPRALDTKIFWRDQWFSLLFERFPQILNE